MINKKMTVALFAWSMMMQNSYAESVAANQQSPLHPAVKVDQRAVANFQVMNTSQRDILEESIEIAEYVKDMVVSQFTIDIIRAADEQGAITDNDKHLILNGALAGTIYAIYKQPEFKEYYQSVKGLVKGGIDASSGAAKSAVAGGNAIATDNLAKAKDATTAWSSKVSERVGKLNQSIASQFEALVNKVQLSLFKRSSLNSYQKTMNGQIAKMNALLSSPEVAALSDAERASFMEAGKARIERAKKKMELNRHKRKVQKRLVGIASEGKSAIKTSDETRFQAKLEKELAELDSRVNSKAASLKGAAGENFRTISNAMTETSQKMAATISSAVTVKSLKTVVTEAGVLQSQLDDMRGQLIDAQRDAKVVAKAQKTLANPKAGDAAKKSAKTQIDNRANIAPLEDINNMIAELDKTMEKANSKAGKYLEKSQGILNASDASKEAFGKKVAAIQADLEAKRVQAADEAVKSAVESLKAQGASGVSKAKKEEIRANAMKQTDVIEKLRLTKVGLGATVYFQEINQGISNIAGKIKALGSKGIDGAKAGVAGVAKAPGKVAGAATEAGKAVKGKTASAGTAMNAKTKSALESLSGVARSIKDQSSKVTSSITTENIKNLVRFEKSFKEIRTSFIANLVDNKLTRAVSKGSKAVSNNMRHIKNAGLVGLAVGIVAINNNESVVLDISDEDGNGTPDSLILQLQENMQEREEEFLSRN